MRVDDTLIRGKAELHDIVGDASKARERLGWSPRVDFEGLVQLLVDADVERLRSRLEPVETLADIWHAGLAAPAQSAGRCAAPPSGSGRAAGPTHSRLFLVYDVEGWVLEYEARQLERTARALGVAIGPDGWSKGVDRQSIFHLSQFTLLLHDFERRGEPARLRLLPRPPGDAGHARVRRVLRDAAPAARGDRSGAGDVERDGGARSSRPESRPRSCTGSRSESTPKRSARARARRRAAARRALGLPESAFVVGSFQKDGVGWGDGLEPKLIKGPDVLLEVAERCHERVPELDRSCSPGPRGATCARGSSGSGFRTATFSFPTSTPSRRRTRRSTSAS